LLQSKRAARRLQCQLDKDESKLQCNNGGVVLTFASYQEEVMMLKSVMPFR
jgi:hypothetical protein